MNQRYSLHNHTIGFDGKNTIDEMVGKARELNFHTIGFSNHFIVNPVIKDTKMYHYAVRGGYSNIYSSSFDEVLDKFIPHYKELEQVQDSNSDIKILRGIEVDFFDNPKWLNGFKESMKILRPDYVIGSAHFVEYNGTLLNSHDWANADIKTKNVLLGIYWNNIAKAAKSGLFTFMAHLDLPKKVYLGLEDKWAEYEARAVSSIAKSGIAMEINTSFYKPYCYEPYPSKRILTMAEKENIPVLISDDAHSVSAMGRHFDEALALIQKLHLKQYQI